MEKKNHCCNNFEVGTANKQGVGKRENRCIQTLSRANCTEAKIRIWYNSCTLSISLLFFPRLEHVSIPLHFFLCLFVCFSFPAESKKFCILQSVTHWMDFLYSDYNAGSCRLNPLGESITHGQSNQEKIVRVILLSFSNPKVIAGWRFKTFILDPIWIDILLRNVAFTK